MQNAYLCQPKSHMVPKVCSVLMAHYLKYCWCS